MIALYQPFAVTTYYFLQAILVGLCLGVFYDVLSGIQLACGRRRWTGYVMDGIFWIAALVVYFVFTVTLAVGQVRGFIVVGMGGGVIFCHVSIGWLVCRMTCTLLKLLMQIVHTGIRYMQTIWHFMQAVRKWFQKNLKKIFKKTSISDKKKL